MLKFNNKTLIATLALSFFIGTANADKKPDAAYQKEIDRIAALDVAEEVERNINEGRLQLYVFHNRGGAIFPGMSEDTKQRLSSACEQVAMPDAGDVVYSSTHLKYMSLAFDYATEYNKQMEGLCIK